MVDVLDIYGKTIHCIKQHVYLVLIRKPRRHIANAGTQGSVGEGESHGVLGVIGISLTSRNEDERGDESADRS